MSNALPIVRFSGVQKSFGRNIVLREIDLAIAPGAFTVIYGRPGSGKTTLIRALLGLEQPDQGQILLRDRDVTKLPAADRDIGYVPQSFALYPHYSVRDNIGYPLRLAGASAAKIEPVVQRAAAMLGIGDLLGKRPDQLSGGQKQRVAIARGIARPADLYVLDDPLAGLDFKLREQLVEDLRRLQETTGAAFLYATSDIIEAMSLASTLAVLDGGIILDSGPPARLYDEPATARLMELVGFPGANFLPGTMSLRDDGSLCCETAVIDIPVTAAGNLPDALLVGLRPEHVRLTRLTAKSGQDAVARQTGRITLREDLGAEEIVYLECNGAALTSVDRHELPPGDLDLVSVTINPAHARLFHPDSGDRIERAAHAPGGNTRHD